MNPSRNRFLLQVYPLFFLTLGLIFGGSVVSANQSTEKSIDAAVERAMKVFQVPGMAVSVVHNGEVVYFGPYGAGLACSQTSGYAQTILNNFIKGYAANFIIKNAKGCYCKVT